MRVSLELGLHTVLAIEVIHLDQGGGQGQASLHFLPGKSLLRKLGQTSHEELARSMPRLYAWLEEVSLESRRSSLRGMPSLVDAALPRAD